MIVTDRQTERWRCTDGECLEDPVHLDIFTRRQVVIDVLIETDRQTDRQRDGDVLTVSVLKTQSTSISLLDARLLLMY